MRRLVISWMLAAWAVVLAHSVRANPADAPPAMKLKSGDRIVFLGDASTGQHGYTAFLADYFALCHPALKLSIRTSSTEAIWRAADGTVNALPTVEADVLSLRPAVVVVSFGAEASGTGFNERQFPYFKDRFSRIVRALKKAGVAVLILTPADFSVDGQAAPADWYGKVIQYECDLAAAEGVTLVDLNARMRELKRTLASVSPRSPALNDGPSLTPAGHALVACIVMNALGVEGSPSSCQIDAVAGNGIGKRCQIEKLAIAADHVSFSRTDEALAVAFPTGAQPSAQFVPGREANHYGLKMTGLQAGKWHLVVENIEVGTFTADELAAGVDLSTLPGPWRAVSESVHQKSIAIETAFAVRCHYGSQPKIPAGAEPQRQTLVNKLDAGIEKLVVEQAEAAHPAQAWNWSLTLSKK